MAGVQSLGDDEGSQALELDVARELLRATPRFWSGAAVYMDFLAFTDLVDTRIVSRDPVPAHATADEPAGSPKKKRGEAEAPPRSIP